MMETNKPLPKNFEIPLEPTKGDVVSEFERRTASLPRGFVLPATAKKEEVGTLEDIGRSATSGFYNLGVSNIPPVMMGDIQKLGGIAAEKVPEWAYNRLPVFAQEGLSSAKKAVSEAVSPKIEAAKERIGEAATASPGWLKKIGEILSEGYRGLTPFSEVERQTGMSPRELITRYIQSQEPKAKERFEYKPSTVPGRITKFGAENIPALAVPGSKATKIASWLGSTVGGSVAPEFVSEPYKPWVSFLGSVAGGSIPPIVVARVTQNPALVDRITGQMLREGMIENTDNLVEFRKALQDKIKAAAETSKVTGVEPTTSQILGSGKFSSIEKQLKALDTASPEAIALQGQMDANLRKMQEAAEGFKGTLSGKIPDEKARLSAMEAASGTTPLEMQFTSPVAKSAFDNMIDSSNAAQKAAWKNVPLDSMYLYRNKSINNIFDKIDNMSPIQNRGIDNEIREVLEEIRNSYTKRDISLRELQDIRQRAGEISRKAFQEGDKTLSVTHSEIAQSIRDVIDNPKNIVFGDTTGKQRKAWSDAVATTKQYYDLIRPELIEKLLAKDAAGIPKISAEAFLDASLKNANSLQNYNILRKTTDSFYRNKINELNPNAATYADELNSIKTARDSALKELEKNVSNWVISKVTGAGTKFDLSIKDINQLMSNPNTASLVNGIPDLKSRLSNMVKTVGQNAEQVRLAKVADAFDAALSTGTPEKLFNFIKNNENELMQIAGGNKNQQSVIKALKDSAGMLRNIKPEATTTETLQKIKNGRMIDILVGKKLGVLSDASILEAFHGIISSQTAMPYFPGLGTTAASTASFMPGVKAVRSLLSSFATGDLREPVIKRLLEAAKDPSTANLLLAKPSPEIALQLARRLSAYGIGTMTQEKAREREGRASGGRIKSGSIADRLLRDTEAAKREINKGTESLLKTPDEHIIKALDLANKATYGD